MEHLKSILESKEGLVAEHKIRITLCSRNAKAVETVCSHLLAKAHDKGVTVKGPVRMPTKVLRITTRKTPCGEGSKTWDRFQMRVHKRHVMLTTTTDLLKSITTIPLEPGVDIEVTVADA
ncbi:hypothetical protein QR680_006832 [Steinernema hermaphroditum]|uniref:Small ribosomal subunit protein uS10 n=1 Tax=Steinernema hermaphroditum TaxID=289476 RepID=A0AA39HWR8_9BILA|nr:hypothetical protein QR680_006832 [Steinernema hermaphroditum]